MKCRHAFMVKIWVTVLLASLWTLPITAAAKSVSSKAAYDKVRNTYFGFKSDAGKKRYRHSWIRVIAEFQKFSKTYPDAKEICRATYTEAELWRGLYEVSRVNSDLRHALGAYEIAESHCVGSSLADDALWNQVAIAAKRKTRRSEATVLAERLVQDYPVSDMAPRARKWLKEFGVTTEAAEPARLSKAERGRLHGRGETGTEGPNRLDEVKYWSNDDYVRVSLYMKRPTEFRVGSIPGDSKKGTTGRIFLDFANSETKVQEILAKTPVVETIRVGKRSKNAIRVVLDLAHPTADYTTLVLENPFRIVVDVARGKDTKAVAKPSYSPKLHKTLVVIDPGHGGKDAGAIGSNGIKEKDVALKISLAAKRVLETAGFAVRLTREKDVFLSLEERTAMANRLNADVFLSIHANAHDDKDVHGVESYYLDTTSDRYALRLAAVENKVREERGSEIQLALAQVSSRLHTEASKNIAGKVTDSLAKVAHRQTGRVRNLGVKPSLFYVLLGARMPAVLIEASFVTNPKDAKLLSSKKGSRALGKAIGEAVVDYVKQNKKLGRR